MEKMKDRSVVFVILLLTIIDIIIKINMLYKLRIGITDELLFTTFYIDVVVLVITYVIYRFITYNYHKNKEVMKEN